MTKADIAEMDAQILAKERVYQAEKVKRFAAILRQPLTESQPVDVKVVACK